MATPPVVTGLIMTDTMLFADCPQCGAAAGKCCVSNKGKRQSVPHVERSAEYFRTYPDREELYGGGQYSATRLARVREYNRVKKAATRRRRNR